MFKKILFYIVITQIYSLTMHAQEKKSIDPKLEIAASFDKARPIGVSVTSTNRLFVSFPKQKNIPYGLTEIIHGKPIPYPNEYWNRPGHEQSHFVNVQDIFVDANDNLWVLDSKPSSSGSIFGSSSKPSAGYFKLLKINTQTNEILRIYTFDDIDKVKSGLNDVRIDVKKDVAYLSDPGQASIVILDLKTGLSRMALTDSPFTLADPTIILSYSGTDMRDKEGKPFRSNVNGIALTQDFKYLYFKPINKTHLYRVATAFLTDVTLSPQELQAKVEDMGDVGVTHGLLADKKGNIYLTTSMDYSVKYLTPEGKLFKLVQDPKLLWPDSLGIGGDGFLYFSCAQLFNDPQWNNGKNRVKLPYYIFKVNLNN